jgi:NADPH:quinone reductase-like Zn-dependent oxidoreductase
MKAQAIVFEAPRTLSVQTLELKSLEPGDIEVEVTSSGISTGTERLLWDGTMPPFPGLGYPLVPGYETVGRIVKAPDLAVAAAQPAARRLVRRNEVATVRSTRPEELEPHGHRSAARNPHRSAVPSAVRKADARPKVHAPPPRRRAESQSRSRRASR